MCELLVMIDSIMHSVLPDGPIEGILCSMLGSMYNAIGCTGGYW